MCGITGVAAFRGGVVPWDSEVILAAACTLRHRGPDDEGVWRDPEGRAVLAHTRLRVIDLDTGSQPMGSEDGRLQITFNGEIYNFRSLRAELEGMGYRFRTRSDTEVILHGYAAWGDQVVERLDGMFAFGLWDAGAGRLLLARDRVGKKPLFLHVADGVVAFASEMKALLALPGVRPEIDPGAFPLYLAWGYVPAPRTLYRGIEKLPPATLRSWEPDGSARERRYWRADFSPRFRGSREEARTQVRTLVEAAVERRLVADVPLGAFLSGGVDSTIVVGLMARAMTERVRTFSIGFADDPTYDETRWAREAAHRFGTEHTEFRVGADSVELIEELVALYDEPFGDSSALPTWTVSRLTREHVTVALTGDGGDELFAGYARFNGMRLAAATPRWGVALARGMGSLLPHHDNFRHPTRRFTRFAEAASLPPEDRWLRWVGYFPDDPWALLRPEVRERAATSLGGGRGGYENPILRSLVEVTTGAGAGLTPLGYALALNFYTYLPEDLLVKADRNSMAHGLELRSPFLDTTLVDFVAGLPDHLRTPRWRPKGILKEAFSDLLPPGISRRGKMGFGVPLPLWFRTRWRGYLEDTLLTPEAATGEWLDGDQVRKVVEEHWSGRRDRSQELWALLTLELWLRRSR